MSKRLTTQITKRCTFYLTESQYENLRMMAYRKGLISEYNGQPSISSMLRLIADGYYRVTPAEKGYRKKPLLAQDDYWGLLDWEDLEARRGVREMEMAEYLERNSLEVEPDIEEPPFS